MKKQSLINLIKYHAENNDAAFASEVGQIAREFDETGDSALADYLLELISTANYYVPQNSFRGFQFLQEEDYSAKPLYLPNVIEEDVKGVVRAIQSRTGMHKFLFYGPSGSGKTESVYQIARMLDRRLLSVNFEQLVDSRLGETAKNVAALFEEINHLPYQRTLVLFDEIDAIVLDRINSHDLREMGRVTSVFLKELDRLSEKVSIIATTNLYDNLDKALIRRFDAVVSFDRYTKEDLIEIADILLTLNLKQSVNSKQDIRLFNKILKVSHHLPFPGDLLRIIKTSIAFSDQSNEYDYLRKIYLALNSTEKPEDLQSLSAKGFTVREIEILTHVPKSSVSRKLREFK